MELNRDQNSHLHCESIGKILTMGKYLLGETLFLILYLYNEEVFRNAVFLMVRIPKKMKTLPPKKKIIYIYIYIYIYIKGNTTTLYYNIEYIKTKKNCFQ